MAETKSFISITLTSQSCLTNNSGGDGDIHKAVGLASGDIIQSGSGSAGILQRAVDSGDFMEVAVLGEFKYTAGGTVGAGAPVTVNASGYLTVAGSGDWVVGRNAELSVASGAVGRGQFNFINPPKYAIDSIAPEAFAFTTSDDLSAAALVGLAVEAKTGEVALKAGFADGVLVTGGGGSGSEGTFRPSGIQQVRAGDVLAAGESLVVQDSGWFTKGDSGDRLVGRALAASAAGNSGNTFLAQIDFATVITAIDCTDVSY